MEIVKIGHNAYLQKEFLKLPVRIYRKNPYWIRPLDKDIENVFDPAVNVYFKNGDCERWLAIDQSGQTVGRIAAFYNTGNALKGNKQPTGGFGFFECANDQRTAFALFDTAKAWLLGNGMEAMDGPINFGERDSRWGLLTDGYELEPNYGMDYHLPYYKKFFEDYGFRNYFDQLTYYLPLDESRVRGLLHPSLFSRAERIFQTPGYEFRHLSKKELPKYTEDFRIIYNKAWASHQGVAEMTPEKAGALMKKMAPILREDLMWFGYHEGQPIAFYIMLPELNQIFKHVNGNLNWYGKLKFLYHTFRQTNKKAFGLIFGVIPEFQKKGIESAIALAYSTVAWRPGYPYKDLEMNWIGDFNPKMIGIVKLLGGKVVKTHTTYRYLFNPDQEFERHPVL